MDTGSSTSRSGFFGRLWSWIPSLSRPLPNPGKFDEFEAEAKTIFSMVDAFDGFQFSFNRGLSPQFLVSHHITLGNSMSPAGTYEFGANYATNNTVLVSKMDTDGNLQARVQHTPSAQAVLLAQAALLNVPHQSSASLEATYRGSDWTGVGTIGTNGRYSATYFQSLTQHLAVGGALEVQSRIPGHVGGASGYTAAFRYNAADWIAAGEIASFGKASLSYVQRVRENCNLATAMVVQLAPGKIESQCAIGMEYRLRVGSFKSFITSSGHGTAVLERKLNPEVSLLLCGDFDGKKDEHKFGIGLVVGGQ